jgi:hypothetical protein
MVKRYINTLDSTKFKDRSGEQWTNGEKTFSSIASR